MIHVFTRSSLLAEENDQLLLDVGCGENPRKGYVGVDSRALPSVRIVCKAWEVDQYVELEAVDKIYSRHFLEHLTFPQAQATLVAFRRIMRHGATLTLIVPNIRYHISQWLDPDPKARSEANENWSVRQHAIAGFWGWQRDSNSSLWDVHKSGYDESTLAELIKENGFVKIKREPDKLWNLHLSARK